RHRASEVEEVLLVPDLPVANRQRRNGVSGGRRVFAPELPTAAVAFDRGLEEFGPGAPLPRGENRQAPPVAGQPMWGGVDERQDFEVVSGGEGHDVVERCPVVASAGPRLDRTPGDGQPDRLDAAGAHATGVAVVQGSLGDYAEEPARQRIHARRHQEERYRDEQRGGGSLSHSAG